MGKWTTSKEKWLVYSRASRKVYCFSCMLFENNSTTSPASIGWTDWKHLSGVIQKHERSPKNFEAYGKWVETEMSLKVDNWQRSGTFFRSWWCDYTVCYADSS